MIKTNNDQGGVEAMISALIFSLTFSSIVIAFLLTQTYGYTVIGNEAPFDLPGVNSQPIMQDYTTNEIADNYNYETGFGNFEYQPGVGRVLIDASLGENWLLLNKVSAINNIYTVNYRLNNSVHGDFGIAVKYTGSNPYDIVVHAAADGFHIHNEMLPFIEYNYYPFANPLQYDKPTIKTVFNEYEDKDGVLDFYFNGEKIFTKSDITRNNIFGIHTDAGWYHAGVESSTAGFAIEQINPGGFGDSSTDTVASIATFFEVLWKIVLWNVNEAFLPLPINIIFIKTQVAALVVCIIVFFRG